MTRPGGGGGGETINRGPGPDRRDEVESETAANAGPKGEDPSPDDRERGETSSADPPPARDFDAVRDRTG